MDIIEFVSGTGRHATLGISTGPMVPLSHLYSRLGQTDLDGQLLSGEDVRVVSPGEGFLQLLQLERGESSPVSSLFPHLGDAVLVSHSNL